MCIYIYMQVRVNIWNPLMSSMFSVSELVSPYKKNFGEYMDTPFHVQSLSKFLSNLKHES